MITLLLGWLLLSFLCLLYWALNEQIDGALDHQEKPTRLLRLMLVVLAPALLVTMLLTSPGHTVELAKDLWGFIVSGRVIEGPKTPLD